MNATVLKKSVGFLKDTFNNIREDFIGSLPIDICGILKIESVESDGKNLISVTQRSMMGHGYTTEYEVNETNINHCIGIVNNVENVLHFQDILKDTYSGKDIKMRIGTNGIHVPKGYLRKPEEIVSFIISTISDRQYSVEMKLRFPFKNTGIINVYKTLQGNNLCVKTKLLRIFPYIKDSDYSWVKIPNVVDNTIQEFYDDLIDTSHNSDDYLFTNILNDECYLFNTHSTGVYMDMIHFVVEGMLDVIVTSDSARTINVSVYDRNLNELVKTRKFMKTRNVPMGDAYNFIRGVVTNLTNLKKYVIPTNQYTGIIQNIFRLEDNEFSKAQTRIHGDGLLKYGIKDVRFRGYTLTQYQTQTNTVYRSKENSNMNIHFKTKDDEGIFILGYEYFRTTNEYVVFEFGNRSMALCNDEQINKIRDRILGALNSNIKKETE